MEEPFILSNGKEREQIVELVRRFGGSTTDAVLDPAMLFFCHPNIEGLVGYRVAHKCCVVFGDPICADKDRAELGLAFHKFVHDKGLRVVSIAASKSYANWAVQHIGGAMIEFGTELIFNSPIDPRKNTGTYGSLVRRKTKQAAREGISIHEYLSCDLGLEEQMEKARNIWLDARRGLQVHISTPYLFTDRFGKRWFYAKQEGKVVGVVVLNRLQAQDGWLLNHLMVIPNTPNGTSELLITTVLETLENEKCPFVTLGAIAAAELGEIKGLSKFSTLMARNVFKLAKKIIKLERLNTFWGKFEPATLPSYLLFSGKRIGIGEIISLKNAMNGTLKNGKH